MASFRNITVNDSGVKWTVTYEWNNDQQTGAWVEFSAQFPRDFGELQTDQVTPTMWELARHVAEAKGIHD